MNPLSRYFAWLQAGAFTGTVDPMPAIDETGETNVAGLFIIGDLTGIPLLKLAAESGKRLIDHFDADSLLRTLRLRHAADDSMLDLLIVGAGPAGVSAGIEAVKRGYRFRLVESSRPFSTIADFPRGKPIFTEPEHLQPTATLRTPAGTKESLLDALEKQLADAGLPVSNGESVESVRREGEHFVVITRTGEGERSYRALRVALAVGRSGSARTLGVPGEELDKVYNRLIDPRQHRNERILVVGGGDSAAESAIALAEAGNSVTLSHRGRSFSRMREGNRRRLEELQEAGAIAIARQTTLETIDRLHVELGTPRGRIELGNDSVYIMVGRRLPVDLLKRCGVEIRGEWDMSRWLLLLYGALFAWVVYFGKKSSAWGADSGSGWQGIWSSLGELAGIPGRAIARFGETASYSWYGWRDLTIDLAAWAGIVAFLAVSIGGVARAIPRIRGRGLPSWQIFKRGYFAVAITLFCAAFIGDKYLGYKLAGVDAATWYSLLYSITIVLFGLRRIRRTPTRYVRLQTYTLMAVQVIPLFLLPVVILPMLWNNGTLTADSWLIRNAFPVAYGGEPEFWRAYGLILAWPLFLYNVFSDQPTMFWLIVSFIQTFIVIPLIVWKWGKGSYCGWICSCGGLAETLGDEYRTAAPHGPTAKKWENAGQWVLLFVLLLTALKLAGVAAGGDPFGIPLTAQGERIYSLVVDILFAGVLGLGVYVVLSGRLWCRYLCPLAALMHIYARFTRFRIFAAKERCISCNVCTSVCHMGIDVMGYANKGIPMNDVQCVRCSACVTSCPMDVLSFGELPAADPANRLYLELPIVQRPASDWRSGRS